METWKKHRTGVYRFFLKEKEEEKEKISAKEKWITWRRGNFYAVGYARSEKNPFKGV